MPELHETMYGKRLFEHQLPELLKQITAIAKSLQEISKEISVLTAELIDEEENN
jgi:hypothetical protein